MSSNISVLRNCFRRGYRALLPLVYARTNYKLFLQRSFTDLDKTIHSLLCTSDVLPNIVKAIPIKPPFGKSMLVIAPHQDDEVIGCGGAMLLQLKTGKEMNVVFVQDGADEYKELGFHSREELVQIREEEASRVAKELKIDKPTFLRHYKLNAEQISNVADQLRKRIIETKAECVFAPFFLDFSNDHLMTNYALVEALTGIAKGKKIYGYEVWSLSVPNVILPIDNVMEMKQNLLSYYSSQLAGTDYLNWVTGLNMYHSKFFGSGICKYAERFFEIPAPEYINVVKKIQGARGDK